MSSVKTGCCILRGSKGVILKHFVSERRTLNVLLPGKVICSCWKGLRVLLDTRLGGSLNHPNLDTLKGSIFDTFKTKP